MARAASIFFLSVLLAPTATLALDEPTCLSQNEIHGGYPRYHVIGGRKCWYAATSPLAKPGAANPSPPAQSAEIEVNPYGDPSWNGAEAKPAPAKPRAARGAPMGGPLVISPAFASPR
jgi:hypothetical protein